MPAEVTRVSVAWDRVSVPMEDALATPGRPAQLGASKGQVWRQLRRAYCAPLPLPAHKGEAVHTLRYGRMPPGEVEEWCRTLAPDVCPLLRKQPPLGVMLLADGAAEGWNLLPGSLTAETLGVPVHQLLDRWHLLEKLGRAARVI